MTQHELGDMEELQELDGAFEPEMTQQEEEASKENYKNAKLMNASGQTDKERRQIRKSQRLLQKTIAEGGESLELEKVRDENNAIFRKVLHTREAVLDGENIYLIAGRAIKKVDRLVQAPRYDADRLVSKLVQKCRAPGGYFDWDLLGSQAGVCFNAAPSNVSFLNGPLSDGKTLQVKQRAKRAPVQEDSEAEEENPEEVKGHTARDANQLSAIEQSMKDLHKTLRKRCNATFTENKRKLEEAHEGGEIPPKLKKKLKKGGMKIDAVQYLFNPNSFTQTVENIFHYSFLIKKGSASLKADKAGFGEHVGEEAPGGLFARYIPENTVQPTPKQAIVSLTMKDWRELCEAHNVTEGDLPHRKGSKKTKRAGLSQTLSQSS
ncbi:unnamed protein product [Cylindrotheca closterium]|uniref:Non-structural maintenance of chromosomes element 4 n=1 Tax=Cylindrotheca closterium TaxID=2856 RepID=A0AAD2FF76_9STRA|nr:unnamed protein product [Cylindrotheca closterium]